MELPQISFSRLAIFAVSGIVSLLISILVWRKSKDSVFLKVFITLIVFIPVLGPLLAMWVISFPNRMPRSMQAKYPRTVNRYPFTDSLLSKDKQEWHFDKTQKKRRRSVRRRNGSPNTSTKADQQP